MANHHLDVALGTASFAGVFPCLPTKRPATEHGFLDATQDAGRIRTWWERNPDHLVGIPTEGLLVVDLDDRPGKPPAWAAWWALAEPHGWDPTTTPMVGTPSGGVHVYWEQPEGVRLRNSASKLAPGIDTRADGGYCIAAGSRLPDGRAYELLDPCPAVLPVAPDWLVTLLARPAPCAAPAMPDSTDREGSRWGIQALDAELGRLALAPEGGRNDALVRSAYRVGQLVAGGQLDAHHAASNLLSVAIRIGLTEGESIATIRSGMGSGAQHPRRPAAA